MTKKYETVAVEQLRWQCSEADLDFKTTDDLQSFPSILGQDRAVRALTMGLEMDYPGYNIFVSGLAGTGRTTTVHFLLKDPRFRKKTPDDICYVNNFKNPDIPTVLYLAAGRGCAFKREMHNLIEHLRLTIPQVMESDNVREKREALLESYTQKQNEIVQTFEHKAREQQFTLVQVQVGPFTKPDVLPVIDGQPVPLEGLAQLVQAGTIKAEQAEEFQTRYVDLSKELAKIYMSTQKLQREKKAQLAALDRDIIRPIIAEPILELHSEFADEKVRIYLDSVQESLLENLDIFRGQAEQEDAHAESKSVTGDPLVIYRVNVIVDHSDKKGSPVIFENSPSFSKLFGTIERSMDANGQWRSDFTKIRAGSLLRANGGYLVMNAVDVLTEANVWPTLKRVLKHRATEINTLDSFFMFSLSALKPEPVEVDVKVIIIGDAQIYQLLFQADDDFKKIFKIKADFDAVMSNDQTNLQRYAEFVQKICADEKLLPFERSAVADVAEYGVRLAGRKNKLSTRFTHIADLLREASYFARQHKAKTVQARHVEQALGAHDNRFNLIEERIHEMISEGALLIDVTGVKPGQVNGLSVLNLGDYMFGQPTRITAQVAMGRAGIISIEREVAMSGPSHDKGVLILAGYLRGKFARNKPLAMSASICFEQSYSGIDGDSASSTEIYALLSRLAEVPVRQNIAVTGSVNQFGEIQPIGGVNEKIEGFFRVCKSKGELSGEQGVMIPRLNVPDLMLSNEVVQAVKKGLFAVYPVDTVEQGIEILTGVPAGVAEADGRYPKDSIYGRADARLTELARGLHEFGGWTSLEG